MPVQYGPSLRRRTNRVRATLLAGVACASGFLPVEVVGSNQLGDSLRSDRVAHLNGAWVSQPAQNPANAQSPIPEWARERWDTFAKARGLQLSQHVKPSTLSADFDGDGKTDLALLVELRTSHKIGIAFLHQAKPLAFLTGAGIELGNGGDNFDWMDSWKVQPRTKARPTDAVLIEREGSGGGLIYFSGGKYRWKQHGD